MELIQRTIDLANANVERGGRPFACIVTRGGEIIAEAVNLVAQTHDPTAHAEICAIREASAKLGTEHFIGCEFYILAHPCPMCLDRSGRSEFMPFTPVWCRSRTGMPFSSARRSPFRPMTSRSFAAS
jgi:tRNA(Arg) A34 adenosine deaminase TadA